MKNYYETLPEGYSADKIIDAKDKKTVILMNLFGVLLMIAAFLLLAFLKSEETLSLLNRPEEETPLSFLLKELLFLGIFLAGNILYMVLHELTHGAVYKAFTRQKLKFGFTGFVAFCGVPNGYVNKKTALCAVLAPFVLFSLIFLPLALCLKDGAVCLLFNLLFSAHFGGCVGDLACAFLLLTKYDGAVLMNDTGPKQTFYVKKN